MTITRASIIKNPHLWVIISISLLIVFIYQSWPWRDWYYEFGSSQWLSWLSPFYHLSLLEFKFSVVGSLFFIPNIYAAIVFSWRVSSIVSVLSLVTVLPILIGWRPADMITLNVILLLSPLLIVSMITVELEWRRKERRIFAEREKERKVYLLKELEVQEDERRRVSQELHDETIQTLLAIANRANALGISGDDSMETVKNDIMWIKDTILQTIDDIRRICINLRPAALDNLGLIDSLRLIVDNINTEHTICSQFLIDGTEHKLSPQAEVMIFRVVQEALNNIKRHSNATKAVVAVKFDNECLTITINDNGKGFHIPKTLDMLATKRKFGLIGMQQRIISLNGTFRIYSRPGEGTSILIKINYESDIAGSNNVYSSSSSSKVC